MLAGVAAERLHPRHNGDLATVRRPADGDPLSRLLQNHWIFGGVEAVTSETECVQERYVKWVAAVVSTAVAAVLLVGAIVVLRYCNSQDAQLGLIAVFMTLFAAGVGLLTDAKRAEIFASTAAYAAVLVVFVSALPTGSNGELCTCVQGYTR